MLVDTPVVIIGGFGLGNFGDDLLMLAAVNAVRKVHDPTDITVLIYRGGERYCRRLDAMPQYVVRQAETTVRSQVAIYGGGTQFYDFQGTSLRRSRWERAQRFLEGLASGRMSLANLRRPQGVRLDLDEKTRRAAISIGLGPFARPESEQSAAKQLAGCEFLSVRDETSMRYCQNWGLEQASLHSDFGYASSLWGADLPALKNSSPPYRIGIIVRDWYRTEEGFRHLAASMELAASLEKRGHKPTFFIFDGFGDTTCRRTVQSSSFSNVIWNPNRLSISDQLDELAACDVLVTSRAHGAIVGSALGIPAICTVIEPKLRIMAETLEDAAVGWESPFEVDDGVKLVEATLDCLDDRRRAAQDVSAKHAESALVSADELADYLQRVAPSPGG